MSESDPHLGYTFLDCYSTFFPLHDYFMPTHNNEEVPVLGKLP
jgi:hypothetical protein